MTQKKKMLLARLEYLWEQHDKMERAIIRLERKFTDRELNALLERVEEPATAGRRATRG